MNGIDLIAAERQRQIEQEGWTPEHDREHVGHPLSIYGFPPLVAAAFTYISAGAHPRPTAAGLEPPATWPWETQFWKPTPDDRVRELVKAGALIAAEIDRIQA